MEEMPTALQYVCRQVPLLILCQPTGEHPAFGAFPLRSADTHAIEAVQCVRMNIHIYIYMDTCA